MHQLTSVLSDAGLTPIVRTTDHPGHATSLITSETDLSSYSAIVSVGGDGTLHEVAAGLLASTETDTLPPLAIVPTGTGNALAVSLNIPSPNHAALNILHALRKPDECIHPISTLCFRDLDGANSPKFLLGGVQWGFPAEVDQGTEWMRALGDARFQIGALAQIAKRRDFHARFTIQVHEDSHAIATRRIEQMRQKPYAGGLTSCGVVSQTGDDEFVFDGRFIMVVAWNSKAIGDGFCLTPLADMRELNVFDVLVIPSANLTRLQMLNFLQSSDGSFLSTSDLFGYFKATSIVFERIEGNYLTVDGESVPVKPFSLEVEEQSGSLSMLDSFSIT